jgi:hypothetical protein
VKRVWKRWVALFEDQDDPTEPHYDPVHLAVVLIASQVVIGVLYWLLWTLLVYQPDLKRAPGVANVSALILCALVVAALYKADRRHAARRRK